MKPLIVVFCLGSLPALAAQLPARNPQLVAPAPPRILAAPPVPDAGSAVPREGQGQTEREFYQTLAGFEKWDHEYRHFDATSPYADERRREYYDRAIGLITREGFLRDSEPQSIELFAIEEDARFVSSNDGTFTLSTQLHGYASIHAWRELERRTRAELALASDWRVVFSQLQQLEQRLHESSGASRNQQAACAALRDAAAETARALAARELESRALFTRELESRAPSWLELETLGFEFEGIQTSDQFFAQDSFTAALRACARELGARRHDPHLSALELEYMARLKRDYDTAGWRYNLRVLELIRERQLIRGHQEKPR